MNHKLLFGAGMALFLPSLSLAQPAATAPGAQNTGAQNTEAPARIANVWNGRHHEPAAGGVRANERAAGIALSQEQKNEQTQTLDRIGRRLTDKARRDARSAPPPPQPPSPSGR